MIVPDATCGNIGVKSKKLSSLTMLFQHLVRLKITFQFSGQSTPANPPLKLKFFFLNPKPRLFFNNVRVNSGSAFLVFFA
ncbi:MAG: hypothetical protein CM1200mP23_3880 [Nitrososphaerota archaeon]|nr:MAG: hypothetical protein CM1200mP23_3880 [Nitrososphaerota archaeon]